MGKLLGNSLFRAWLAVAGTATLIIGASYAMVQQSDRLSADDLPLAASQTAVQELQSGTDAKDVLPALKTDMRTSTTVFLVITDSSQHILASSALLDGKTPLPPAGVFSFAAAHGSDRFTWEPAPGVRAATRVTKYGQGQNTGFIIAGQSLQPFEDRIANNTWIALAAWLASLAWSYLLIVLPHQRSPK